MVRLESPAKKTSEPGPTHASHRQPLCLLGPGAEDRRPLRELPGGDVKPQPGWRWSGAGKALSSGLPSWKGTLGSSGPANLGQRVSQLGVCARVLVPATLTGHSVSLGVGASASDTPRSQQRGEAEVLCPQSVPPRPGSAPASPAAKGPGAPQSRGQGELSREAGGGQGLGRSPSSVILVP